MDSRLWVAVIFLMDLGTGCLAAADWTPKVLVYSSDMPGFAQGLAELLANQTEGINFLALDQPAELSSLLAMPDVTCVILPVMTGSAIRTLVDPLCTYFHNGGALVGFQGCCDTKQVGLLATEVFPMFGNSTGSPVIKDAGPANEYVRDQALEAFGDLPESFDLVGQFFSYSGNATRQPVDPQPAEGLKTVLFRESRTKAPLVVAYETPGSSRSVCFAGCFVKAKETERNYYGRLLEDPIFIKLIRDALAWTTQGVTRSSRYESSYKDLIQGDSDRLQSLLESAARSEKDRKSRRQLSLSATWVLGITAIAALVYLGFLRPSMADGKMS